jgi:ribonuclease Y
MTELIIAAAASVVAFALGYLANHLYRQMKLNKKIGLKKDEAEVIIENARKEAEKVRAQGELKAKEIVERRSSEIENESRERQREAFKTEKAQKREEILKEIEGVEEGIEHKKDRDRAESWPEITKELMPL